MGATFIKLMFIVSIDQSHSNVLVFMRKLSSFNVASVNLGAGREEGGHNKGI